MVKVLTGNLFDSEAQTLVNTVNCVGVMGKGIALEFKKHFPDMFKDYVAKCNAGTVKLGKPYLYKRLLPPWILNFPTKDHWRSMAKLDDIVHGLEYLLQHYKEWGIESLAVPPLGCGQGQLEWRIVGPTLYRYLKPMNIPVELYAPYGTPHEELLPEYLERGAQVSMPEPEWIEPAWVALVEIVDRIERQPYHPPVGRVSFQKIAYVATEEGLPTGLEFRKGSFGPYSRELKPLTTRLLNNGLIAERRLGRMFAVQVGPTFQDAKKAYLREVGQWDPIIERTTDLFMRMNTAKAEIAATILFVVKSLEKSKSEKPTEREVLEAVMNWKQRRRPSLNEEEVALSIRNLAALGRLNVKASPDLPLPEEEVLNV
jgi:O-acetyl-ADP-ribose deacetylase (regulator of RNase III)/uncharacterized protein YwgA